MPRGYIPEITSRSSLIYISHSETKLGQELIRQLSGYHFLHIITTHSGNFPDISILIVDHKFSIASLAIHQDRQPSKIILVLSNHSPHYQSIRYFLSRAPYAHLPISAVEAPPKSTTASVATAIIRKFLPNHKNQPAPTFLVRRPRSRIIVPLFLFLVLAPILSGLLFIASFHCLNSTYRVYNSPFLMPCRIYIQSFSVGLSLIAPPLKTPLGLAKQYSDSLLTVSNVQHLFTNYFYQSISGTTPDSGDFAELNPLLTSLNNSVSTARSDLRKISPPPSILSQLPIIYSQKLNQLSAATSVLRQLLPELPRILPLQGTIHYLILVQDSTELRPSGGYLDTAALVTFNSGILRSIEIYPITGLSSTLASQPPPKDLKLLNPSSTWYMRDSNWIADFPTASRQIASFFTANTGRAADFVVAINLESVQLALEILGPVQISGVDQSITAKNFHSLLLAQISQKGAGSPFISPTTQSLATKVKSATPSQIHRLVSMVSNQLQDGQIFIVPQNFSLKSLSQTGWTGALTLPTCRKFTPCISDYLYPVETNVGTNKINAFVLRSQSIKKKFTKDRIQTRYSLTLQNTARSADWPGGTYNNYFRLYLPPDIKFDKLLLNNQPVSSSDYHLDPQNGLTQLSINYLIPPNTSTDLTLEYTQLLSQKNLYSYQLDLNRQPGTTPSPLVIVLEYPPDWYLTAYEPPSIAKPGSLEYNTRTSAVTRLELDIHHD